MQLFMAAIKNDVPVSGDVLTLSEPRIFGLGNHEGCGIEYPERVTEFGGSLNDEWVRAKRWAQPKGAEGVSPSQVADLHREGR